LLGNELTATTGALDSFPPGTMWVASTTRSQKINSKMDISPDTQTQTFREREREREIERERLFSLIDPVVKSYGLRSHYKMRNSA